jgi:RNA polymerase sigma-70 factor (ECF subfamily)
LLELYNGYIVLESMEMMKEITDRVLLFEISHNNDEEAFKALFERYAGRIFNLIFRMIQHYEDSNDLLQETFLRVYKHRHKCYEMKNFKGWLYTVALNLSRDYLRMSKRRREKVLDERRENIDERDPSKLSESSELRRKVLKAMKKLNVKYRAVFTLRDIQGMSYQEIAKALNIEEGTVKSRLNRARISIARELEGII